MKRIFILITVALFLSGALFAEEAILIDFGKLAADITVNDDSENAKPNQNRQTVMDYGQVAGGSYTEEQKGIMKTSLAITNWNVIFTSSSRTVTNEVVTYTREATSKQWGTVLGVRVHFPVEHFYSKAYIRPPFEIPAYEPQANIDDEGNTQPSDEDSDGITGPSRFEDGFGVVKNVGTIKAIAVNAYGLQFPHGLSVILLDSQGTEKSMFMGYLNYDGWAELTWNNPQYVLDVRNRELRIYPIYPTSTPFVKFNGFRLDRDADKEGGDFVAYFKDVKIIYDKAVLDTDRDIDDESLWGIIQTRETAKKVWEMKQFGQNQLLRYLEGQKQATENVFQPTPAGEQQ
ncbi:flagellar filament outer layer protein FlaA [Leadbettera azotonutricia]|uniref:Flagellar filament outer layer protein (Sheath protein) n=1 Tax=Leadbettera azotonutricia (strain ATCC BAA-888 / DSM 13862 / ZAS-9) TaxID=545695 RepID=F5Y6R7_LEAAZ|nr:flagellar filament outer layer protein FlaA [Leadbettera azotonutricia]AEF82267.1 flagellar filament outer layer protein (Sheath protein) [Leadbettera azotonutricia ZAS-9]